MARFGIQPANRFEDDIVVYDSQKRVQCTFQMLRQQNHKRLTRNLSLLITSQQKIRQIGWRVLRYSRKRINERAQQLWNDMMIIRCNAKSACR